MAKTSLNGIFIPNISHLAMSSSCDQYLLFFDLIKLSNSHLLNETRQGDGAVPK